MDAHLEDATPMGRQVGTPMVFYHHTTEQRAHEVLLYGFPSGPDGIDVLLSKVPEPAEGQVVIRVALPSTIGPRAWSFARLAGTTGELDIRVPGSLLKDASLTMFEAFPDEDFPSA